MVLAGSESEDNESAEMNGEEGEIVDGPPPLTSEDHYHVFFYHSSNADDQDQVDQYVSSIENRYSHTKIRSAVQFHGRILVATGDMPPERCHKKTPYCYIQQIIIYYFHSNLSFKSSQIGVVSSSNNYSDLLQPARC